LVLEPHGSGASNIAGKIDFLIQAAAQGVWPRFALGLSGFFLISLILSVVLAVWVGTAADTSPPSFLLLSKKAQDHKAKVLEAKRRPWLKFIVSVPTSILVGVIANIVFAEFFTTWVR
jgi:hypothetical protein